MTGLGQFFRESSQSAERLASGTEAFGKRIFGEELRWGVTEFGTIQKCADRRVRAPLGRRQPSENLNLGSSLRGGLNERQSTQGDAGLQKSVSIVRDVCRIFPTEIFEMACDGEGRKAF
jgi:hypothetical protein